MHITVSTQVLEIVSLLFGLETHEQLEEFQDDVLLHGIGSQMYNIHLHD